MWRPGWFGVAVPRGRFPVMSRFYKPQFCTYSAPILLRLPQPRLEIWLLPRRLKLLHLISWPPAFALPASSNYIRGYAFMWTPWGDADVPRRPAVSGVTSIRSLQIGIQTARYAHEGKIGALYHVVTFVPNAILSCLCLYSHTLQYLRADGLLCYDVLTDIRTKWK